MFSSQSGTYFPLFSGVLTICSDGSSAISMNNDVRGNDSAIATEISPSSPCSTMPAVTVPSALVPATAAACEDRAAAVAEFDRRLCDSPTSDSVALARRHVAPQDSVPSWSDDNASRKRSSLEVFPFDVDHHRRRQKRHQNPSPLPERRAPSCLESRLHGAARTGVVAHALMSPAIDGEDEDDFDPVTNVLCAAIRKAGKSRNDCSRFSLAAG